MGMGGLVGIGLLLVYFGYGLAFWAMGLAVLLESGRAQSPAEAASLRWLAAFGLVHGTHEWLEGYLLLALAPPAGQPTFLAFLRLGVLAVSFICLLVYAARSILPFHDRLNRLPWRILILLFVLLVSASILGGARALGPSSWPGFVDAVIRYTLAVPSAALAATAVWTASHSSEFRRNAVIAASLRIAAAGFAAYAAAQLFVHSQPWFPASIINLEAFLGVTGVPIQALRGIIAGVIAFGLLRAMQAEERSRRLQLLAAQEARLAAVAQQDVLRRDLLRHVVRSQEDERARIARELHDEIAQYLSAMSLQLGALRTRLRRAGALDTVDRLQDLTRQMAQSLYQLVRGLRPSHLDSLGLVPALRFVISQDFGPRGLDVNLEVHGEARALPGRIDTGLFRIVQESLTNVLRHAGTTQADVHLDYTSDAICVRICDGGRGFDPREEFSPPRGWGLAGIRERVEGLGGTLHLHSVVKQGTTIEVIVPIEGRDPGDPGS